MITKDAEIKIDESGFFTPGKGLSQMMVSLFIWIITGIIYKLISLLSPCIDYVLVCFLASLSLAIISGVMINRRLMKRVNLSNRFYYGLANILLLYTSANGMQAAYCVISAPANNEIKCASVIPFLDSRPWLPDLYHKDVIRNLEEEVSRLRSATTTTYVTPTDDPNLQEINRLKEENKTLRDQYDACINKQPVVIPAETDNSQLYNQISVLQQRIIAFNNKQAEWPEVTGQKFDGDIGGMMYKASKDPSFFKFLFYTPIDQSLFIQLKKTDSPLKK